MNSLSTLYLRFESKPQIPNEEVVVDGIQQACQLGCQEIRITGDPSHYESIFLRVLDIVKNEKLHLSFDLNQEYLTQELIEELKGMDNIYNFAVNIRGDLNLRQDLCFEGLIANLYLDASNVQQAEATIKILLEEEQLQRVKIITSIQELSSIDVYLELVETLKRLHKIYKERLNAMIPWALLDHDTLTLGRKVCQYSTSVGIFLDGGVTVCGVARSLREPTSFLSDASLIDIITNDPFLCQLRETTPETITGVCQRCLFRNYCANLCPAQVYNETSDFNRSYSICQILDDNGYFPANCLLE